MKPSARRPAATEERRVIQLAGQDVPYVLRRSVRRTFALQIDHRGVKVAVPRPAREADVERFITGHQDWLLGKLAARQARSGPLPFEPVDGACLPILGENCRLRVSEPARSSHWRQSPDGTEELVLGKTLDPRGATIRALRKRALPWFAERVAAYCLRLGRSTPPVRLSSARTRWGSCSSVSGIRLHWRLIHLPPELIDYVVAHEVAHLVEMNHSPRFWAVVAQLYPDWKTARTRLRAAGRTLPLIEPGSGDEPLNED
ncbi:M48 family metallopeptidase [Aromatoleum aromaticum]|uniref:YgjP-like metallopeptidase domain-containing protein n=1 Tax=Aromatoleum aromaticum (strain DSM 19018 / LMG 30748 / EbN1) TaxID=76114 RepID=Q5P270_AROAE|nr:SprT family zinc-dependent metalloprotease [Aromatoleum aromaticum]CAI08594.1 conserved hypothetical protein [Aromatoleum aromaticum EbN1]